MNWEERRRIISRQSLTNTDSQINYSDSPTHNTGTWCLTVNGYSQTLQWLMSMLQKAFVAAAAVIKQLVGKLY